jgi:hypothetical protein
MDLSRLAKRGNEDQGDDQHRGDLEQSVHELGERINGAEGGSCEGSPPPPRL